MRCRLLPHRYRLQNTINHVLPRRDSKSSHPNPSLAGKLGGSHSIFIFFFLALSLQCSLNILALSRFRFTSPRYIADMSFTPASCTSLRVALLSLKTASFLARCSHFIDRELYEGWPKNADVQSEPNNP